MQNNKLNTCFACDNLIIPHSRNNTARNYYQLGCGHFLFSNLDRRQRQAAEKSVNAIIAALVEFSPAGANEEFHASQEMISNRARVSRKTVRKWLPRIIEAGLLKVMEKHCAYPLKGGDYQRFATVYRFPRGANHSYNTNTESSNSVFKELLSNNLSKSQGDFDVFESIKVKPTTNNTEIDIFNQSADEFLTVFEDSCSRWKRWRREKREKQKAEQEKTRKSILNAIAEQDNSTPRLAINLDEAPTHRVVQPKNRPRCSCGSLLRLTINRCAGKKLGVYFFHCPKCGQTHDFREIYLRHYLSGTWIKDQERERLEAKAYWRSWEHQKSLAEKRRQEADNLENKRKLEFEKRKAEKKRKAKLVKQRLEAEAETKIQREKDKQVKNQENQREYFRKIAAGEIKVDFKINPIALAAAIR